MNEEIKNEVLQFLTNQKGGVLGTVSGDQPQSAFVYYVSDKELNIYFATVIKSRKYQNIENHKKVSFTVSSLTPPQTVQLEGIVEIIDNKNISEAIMPSFLKLISYQVQNETPMSKMDLENGVVLYRIKPTWLKWSDYSGSKSEKGHPLSVILIE